MLLCVDLLLRGKSLKWWRTTNSWHRGLMGPSSPPARKWPTSALSCRPPAADWQSWVPAAPLAWRTTTSTTTTMTAPTTTVSVTACLWICVKICVRSRLIPCRCVWVRVRTWTCVSVLKSTVGSIQGMCSRVTYFSPNSTPEWSSWVKKEREQEEIWVFLFDRRKGGREELGVRERGPEPVQGFGFPGSSWAPLGLLSLLLWLPPFALLPSLAECLKLLSCGPRNWMPTSLMGAGDSMAPLLSFGRGVMKEECFLNWSFWGQSC